ncbi:SIS domain-containing protein [Nocardioides sp.]|uniref:SIS domain-containing protein n=1 Tax=Nocardioides sp. TaxID=35761 RepID=UPI00261E7E63|nr:SIS domain-containing protein [Nocardioides sp.]
MYFDEARLDDAAVLGTADLRLRGLAESGARVRREATAVAEVLAHLPERLRERPRAVILIGSGARLVELAGAISAPVPMVVWRGVGLPGWVGALDLVLAVAPDGGDPELALTLAEASRRGCRVVASAPESSILADHVSGADSVLLPVATADAFAVGVAALDFLAALRLTAPPGVQEIADVLDRVALECTPFREFSLNPAKLCSIALSESVPLVWGGSVLAADAARQVAVLLRRAAGRPALSGDADGLLPILEATRVASIFDDPIEDGLAARPALLLLDEGVEHASSPALLAERRALVGSADARTIRVEVISAESGGALARYAHLLLSGRYAAEYLHLGFAAE